MGKAGTLVVVVAFIVVGGASAGGGGAALLPTYWQHIGALLPPRYAVDLYRNVRYFGAHDIAVPIAVLALYALAGVALVLVMERRRGTVVPVAQPASGDVVGRARFVPKDLVAPVAAALIMSAFFAVNYMSSGHSPVANNMPFGVVGSTELAQAAQGDLLSLQLIGYTDEQAAKDAIDRGEIYGALNASSSPAELVTVPSISDISALDLAANFEQAAKSSGAQLTVTSYVPTPLAPRTPSRSSWRCFSCPCSSAATWPRRC